MAFITDGKIGVDLTRVASTPAFALGTMAVGSDGTVFEYCRARSEISQYAAVVIFEGNSVRMAETSIVADAGGGKKIGFAQVSIASAFYGWVARQGKVVCNLADDCADNLPLFTTATAGYLDDATVSNCLVLGVYLPVTASLATALTVIAGLPAVVTPYTNPA
jgi:hypothetical protein